MKLAELKEWLSEYPDDIEVAVIGNPGCGDLDHSVHVEVAAEHGPGCRCMYHYSWSGSDMPKCPTSPVLVIY